jgi:hypothetical protein
MFVVKLRRLVPAFDPNHCAGSRIGLDKIHRIGFPVQTGVPMLSHTHQHLTDPATRGFGRVAGFALIAAILVLLLLALLTNPVLP